MPFHFLHAHVNAFCTRKRVWAQTVGFNFIRYEICPNHVTPEGFKLGSDIFSSI